MRRTLAQERGNTAAERPFNREEYEKYAAQIGEGLILRHRKFGEGVVVEVQGGTGGDPVWRDAEDAWDAGAV